MTHHALAQQFGDCLVGRDYAAACALLTQDLQVATTPEGIRSAVATMTAYASSAATAAIREAIVMEDVTVEDWPGQQPGDLAVVYVALNGDDFSEAVTLTLAQYGEKVLIRDLVWGRP